MSELDYAAPVLTEMNRVETIEEAIAFFDGLTIRHGFRNVFRGHRDTSWRVVPSIFRDDMNVLPFESRIIRDLISLYPAEFESDKSMFDRLVRMQHFGLRTRLMDVTKNPLVALYFAVEDSAEDHLDGGVVVLEVPDDRVKYFDSDSVSCASNLANLTSEEKEIIERTTATTISELHKLNPVDRLYQFIRAEKPEFRPRIRREDLFRPLYVIPKMNNKRILAQNGAFLLFGLSMVKAPAYKRGIAGALVVVPSSAKLRLRDSLDRLGYNDSALFPDIERSAKYLMKRYAATMPF